MKLKEKSAVITGAGSGIGITEEEVIKNVMLRETVDGEFTSLEDVAATAIFLASFSQQRAHWPINYCQPRILYALATSFSPANAFLLGLTLLGKSPKLG